MNWLTERDVLIAQRIAFVQSVAGATPGATAIPDAAAKPLSPSPRPASVSAASPQSISIGSVPLDSLGENAFQSEYRAELPSSGGFSKNDIRKELQTRIAAFQAHQHRFHRERDAYFNSVLTKVRSAIETGDKFGRTR